MVTLSHTAPLSRGAAVRLGRYRAAKAAERPSLLSIPALRARGFNLITCFICANLFSNQSCSARIKEVSAGLFALLVPRERFGQFPWMAVRPAAPRVGRTAPWHGCKEGWGIPGTALWEEAAGWGSCLGLWG